MGFKRRVLTFLYLLMFIAVKAQYMEGYATSDYAGVNGISYNPASVVDSRTKLDINFFTVSTTIDNNFLGITKNWANPRDSTLFEYAVLNNDSELKNVFINADVLGPSFLLTLNEKTSIGFTSQFRSLTNFENVSEGFANLYYSNLYKSSFVGNPISSSDMSFEHATWNEYGVVYGQEIYSKNHHWVSAGARFKLIQGLQAASIHMENLSVELNSDSTVQVKGTGIDYLTSSNLDNHLQGNLKDLSNLGVGFDIGFTYEWRASPDSLDYEMDGLMNPAREMSKHKFRFGFTLSDVGFVNYKTGSSGVLSANSPSWNPNSFDLTLLEGFEDAINSEFSSSQNYSSYKMALPTSISFQADYNIARGFYVNATYLKSISNEDKVLSVRYKDRLTVTPRWDWKWLGVYVPYSVVEGGENHLGLNVMFGPFLLGTSDIGTYLWKKENYYANFHFGIKVTSLHRRPNDFDKDEVSDEFDKCIETPGIWAFSGCPDTDGDSIPDASDKCPNVAGLKAFNGCPDTDQDGVTDMQDECPLIPGVIDLHGCPDRDGDGIIDAKDACPDEIGLSIFNGCPDLDGDSIIDKLDACPELFGDALHQGCPDSDLDGVYDNKDSCVMTPGEFDNNGCPYKDNDGDGVINKTDKCPEVFGLVNNQGCPLADQDSDGILDKDDECPKTAGVEINHGCPVINDEDEEIIDFAFKNLQFETGKSIIKIESYPALDGLAEMLVNKTWRLQLSGHTDDVGNAQNNLVLSKKRVESTKNYLIARGVDPENLILQYFGESKPIADNKSEAGRQKNRRVEMEIVFE